MAHSFQSFTHAMALLKKLNSQRELGCFCDCVIRLHLYTGKLYLAHRNILAASSPVLASLLSDQGTLLDLHYPSLTPETLTLLLEFIYTGSLPPPGLEDSVHSAATCLEMEELQQALTCRRAESPKNMETGDIQAALADSPSAERNVMDLCTCKGSKWPFTSAPLREGVPVIRHVGVAENKEERPLRLQEQRCCTKPYLMYDSARGFGADCMLELHPGRSSVQRGELSGAYVCSSSAKVKEKSQLLHWAVKECEKPPLQCTGQTVITTVLCSEIDYEHGFQAGGSPVRHIKKIEDSAEVSSGQGCIHHEMGGDTDGLQSDKIFTTHQSFEDRKYNLIGYKEALDSCLETCSDRNQICVVQCSKKSTSSDPDVASSCRENQEGYPEIPQLNSSGEGTLASNSMTLGIGEKGKERLLQPQKQELAGYRGCVTYHCLERGQETDSEDEATRVHGEASATNSPVPGRPPTMGAGSSDEVLGNAVGPAQPYWCGMCERAFSQRGSLNRHLRSHQGVRPYPCPRCPMTFSRQYRVQEHLRVHQRSCEHPHGADPS
ncbi:uncharacterized protein [Paramormyrops kingsleyae]|uniref:uncharacterized protein n=1 Tax=Paramormyrops kingsleyae TaxID=1676925 RepID=UPI000CD5CC67|nr:zinc finger and BTB domain-containing protein 17-like [Paramormyrops kingsleyae]XP_023684892.1 zinc finger and BTB domain-containing protein 17-like [Paramormyrops kingsleyae]